MTTRQISVTDVSAAPATRDIILRTPPNWTAVCFFAGLAALHLSIALPAFYNGRWEGFLSLAFGVIFTGVAVLCWLVCSDMTIERSAQRIRLRTGYRRLCLERFIPFKNVHGVRLMMMPGKSPLASSIELLCDNEDLQCPPTDIPRQQALCLAMTMNVRLIKVFSEDLPEPGERLESMPSDRL